TRAAPTSTEIADVNGGAVLLRAHDDVVDVANVLDEPLAANDVLFLRPLDVGAARVRVVAFQRLENPVERHLIGDQLVGIDLNLVRLHFTAEGIHFDDTRN